MAFSKQFGYVVPATISEVTPSTLDGILAADGSTVAVASAAQAAAQAITDPGNLYDSDTTGGQLQEVKALADDVTTKASINEITTAVRMPHTHRILMAEVNPSYTEPQLPFALEAFRGGYLIENCNFEAMVANAGKWKYECDILVIAAHQLDPQYTVTAQDVYNSVAEYMAAGVKILLFAQDGGRLQKYSPAGVGDTKVSLLPLFGCTFAVKNMSAGTGSFSQADPYPLTIDVLGETFYPQGSSMPDFNSTDTEVLFPIIATQDALTAKCVACKPGVFAVIGYGGAISGDIPHSAYYQYVKSDALVQLLLNKPIAATVSMDLIDGKKIAAVGVDADVTDEPEAIQPIIDAFGAHRKLEIGLVANKVTDDIADWYRNLYGIYLCSHTYYHAMERETVIDELVAIDPVTYMGRVKHPCKIILTAVKNAADDTPFTITSTTSYRTMPAQGTIYFWRDAQTNTSNDGYIKVNSADAGLAFKVSYTYTPEYTEHLGSIEKLRSMGALTDDVLYLTAGNGAMMPNSYKYALDHNVVICEYQNFPNNYRLRVGCYPIREKVPTPMGYMFHYKMGVKVNDAYWLSGYTKATAKSDLIPTSIAYCNDQKFPYVLYIHDFPFSITSASRVYDNESTTANADWVKETLQETRDYMREFLEWLIAQFEAQGCIWMTRGQFTRRYYDMQRYLAYGVEQSDSTVTLRVQNRGSRPLDGLTFRVPLASAPTVVVDSNGAAVPNQYVDGMLLLWFDAQPASATVIKIT